MSLKKRSFSLSGHRTSIALEAEFWAVIEQGRDSLAMKFLKSAATVLSLGAAHLFGIWRVKGQGVAKKIEAALTAPAPHL